MLREWRQMQATTENVELYRILQNKTINEIADTQPETNIDLLAITGLGPKKVQKYGKQLLEIVVKASAPETQNKVSETDVDGSISVSEFISRINFSLAKHTVRIRGEITDRVKTVNKAVYFRIKDMEQDAILDCFAWRDTFEGKGVFPEEGAEVILEGQVQIYPPTGRFSLQVKLLELRGEGLLKKAFEKLRKELEMTGAFAESRKRPIDDLPRRIALVTALQSDAETDFMTHIGQHGITIDKYDVRVEGIKSESSIITTLNQINKSAAFYDAIVITRGGGSMESLQSFNARSVVEAIMSCRYPVISAVGHERDVTLCDLVADVRVSTPTDAGKLIDTIYKDFLQISDNKLLKITNNTATSITRLQNNLDKTIQTNKTQVQNLLSEIDNTYQRSILNLRHLINRLQNSLQQPNQQVQQITTNMHYWFKTHTDLIDSRIDRLTTEFKSKASAFDHDLQISITRFYSGQYSYRKTISSQTTELTEWHRTIKHSFFSQLVTLQTSITNSQKFLHAQNPETILQKGYAIVSDDNRTIRSADTARQHKSLNLEFIDGKIQVINQDYDQ